MPTTVLPHMASVLAHGGMGTVASALAADAPRGTLADALQRVLADPGFRTAALPHKISRRVALLMTTTSA